VVFQETGRVAGGKHSTTKSGNAKHKAYWSGNLRVTITAVGKGQESRTKVTVKPKKTPNSNAVRPQTQQRGKTPKKKKLSLAYGKGQPLLTQHVKESAKKLKRFRNHQIDKNTQQQTAKTAFGKNLWGDRAVFGGFVWKRSSDRARRGVVPSISVVKTGQREPSKDEGG